MTDTSIEQQSRELVQEAYGKEWVAVALSEKKRDPTWESGERCFLVALRKPEHAHLPFPGPLPKGMEDIPNRAACIFWQKQHCCILDSSQLFEFSQDQTKPTTTTVMQEFRIAIQKGRNSISNGLIFLRSSGVMKELQ